MFTVRDKILNAILAQARPYHTGAIVVNEDAATDEVMNRLEPELKRSELFDEMKAALEEIKETHLWLWEKCDRGQIDHTDFFNRNANSNKMVEDVLNKANAIK
jgi:hypothetical protein